MTNPVFTLVIVYLTGGVIIFLARSLAYWHERSPWTFRAAGGACLLLGVALTCVIFGPASALRALVACVAVGAALVAQDVWVERAEEALKKQRERAWHEL